MYLSFRTCVARDMQAANEGNNCASGAARPSPIHSCHSRRTWPLWSIRLHTFGQARDIHAALLSEYLCFNCWHLTTRSSYPRTPTRNAKAVAELVLAWAYLST